MTEPRASLVELEVQARLTALLYRNAELSMAVNVAVSAAVPLLGTLGGPGRIMIAWWVAMVLVACFRLYQARAGTRAIVLRPRRRRGGARGICAAPH
jgi:hypothetical protein